jgi:hypothetical protein
MKTPWKESAHGREEEHYMMGGSGEELIGETVHDLG